MLTAIQVMLNAFLEICLFRKNPQDLPKSNILMCVSIVGYMFASTLLALLSEQLAEATMAGIVEAMLVMLFTYGLLQIRSKTERWPQTVTALSGTGIIISLIAFPLYYMGSTADQDGIGQSIGLLLLIVLIIWNIAIMAHIFRHALQTTLGFGIAIAVSYIWIISSFITILFSTQPR